MPILARDGELDLTEAEAALLVAMSAATIERRLGGERAKMIVRGRSHTKPGSWLKSQIPILVRHAHRRLWGRGEAGEILYLRAKLTLSSPSIRRANKDELPSIAGFLVDNALRTGDRV